MPFRRHRGAWTEAQTTGNGREACSSRLRRRLGAQDLLERGLPHLELRGRRLARAEDALELVPGARIAFAAALSWWRSLHPKSSTATPIDRDRHRARWPAASACP
jgi:hypothetical protein